MWFIIFGRWFLNDGWVVTLACLNLLIVIYVVIWLRRANSRWLQTELKYRSLSQRYEGAFRALDQSTRDYESSAENLKRVTREFGNDAKLDDTQVRKKKS